jgi:hypothetical protein
MNLRSQSVIDRFPTEHAHGGTERCPLCDQTLPNDLTAEDLQARLRDREREAGDAAEKRLRAQFEVEQAAKIEALKKQAAADAAEREKVIRIEAKALAETVLQAEIARAREEAAKATREKDSAVESANKLKAEHEERIKQATQQALQEQREVLEKEQTNAVHQIQAQEFEKTQKLQKQVELLSRQLDQKTAGELGEGAEIDLYEALRESFEGDQIIRIKKGQPGADILHKVVHNGQICGTIIYDSKNHNAWRCDFVEKLKADQLAAQADHAVLATRSFPTGTRQLCVRDDVIVCHPARTVELVGIIREHIIRTYRLRLGAHERGRKTEALYEFINSDRCQQLLDRSEAIAEDLLDLDVKEVKAHEVTWKKRGQLIRDSQKVHGDFRAEVDRIVEDGSVE